MRYSRNGNVHQMADFSSLLGIWLLFSGKILVSAKPATLTNSNGGSPTYIKHNGIEYSTEVPMEALPFEGDNSIDYSNHETLCKGNTCDEAAQEILSSMNASIDPCDDFYKFACQGWQKQNPRPTYAAKWDVFGKVEDENNGIVIDILNEPVQVSDLPTLATAKRFFKKCMTAGTTTTNHDKNKDLQLILETLEEYGGWPILYESGTWNSSRFDWIKSIVALKKLVAKPNLLDVVSHQSWAGNVSENSIYLIRPSAGLSSLKLLTKDTDDKNDALEVLQDYVVNVTKELLEFSGKSNVNETYLKGSAFQILYLLDEFEQLKGLAENRGSKQTKFTLKELQQTMNFYEPILNFELNVSTLLNMFYADTDVYISDTQPLVVPSLDYLLTVASFINALEKESLANYLHFALVTEMLSIAKLEPFKGYSTTLANVVYGTGSNYPRDRVCADVVKNKFTFALDYAFVKRKEEMNQKQENTLDESLTKVRSIFQNLKHEFQKLIDYSTLLYIDTFFLGIELYLTDICPGYPSWVTQNDLVENEYKQLPLSTSYQLSASYLEQNIAINKWAANKELYKLTLSNREWISFSGDTTPYNRKLGVYAPLGILQLPFFQKNLPNFINYGRLGSTLGHEISHGIYGAGWTQFINGSETPTAQCFIAQYNNYTFDSSMSDKNLTINGISTLEENVADNAGLLAAYRAYQEISESDNSIKLKGLEKYSNDQLFYLAFAQNWCEATTDNALEISLKKDDHTPGRFRVLGTLQNSVDFSQAWGCPMGSNMNPGPAKTCASF